MAEKKIDMEGLKALLELSSLSGPEMMAGIARGVLAASCDTSCEKCNAGCITCSPGKSNPGAIQEL